KVLDPPDAVAAQVVVPEPMRAHDAVHVLVAEAEIDSKARHVESVARVAQRDATLARRSLLAVVMERIGIVAPVDREARHATPACEKALRAELGDEARGR